MGDEQNTLFGQIAFREGHVTAEQLEGCLAEQKNWCSDQPVPRLGELMAGKGYLTAEQVRELLETQQRLRADIDLPGYEILLKVGGGGMGTVYKARQISMDKTVAIKVLASKFADDNEYIARFTREARAAGHLNHLNNVQGFDVGEQDGKHYFVMEYVPGTTVGTILTRQGSIDEHRALRIALQISRALQHAHSHGIIHRDVKPDNIIITPQGVAKLTDLGLAKSVAPGADSSVTLDGKALGTPYYASPEQADFSTELDILTDIYSLGATLYHMVDGNVPFDGPTPAAVMAKHIANSLPSIEEMSRAFSPWAAAIVHKMMAKDRLKRYQTPEELIADLEISIKGKMPGAAKEYPPRQLEVKPLQDKPRGPGAPADKPARPALQPRPQKRSLAPVFAAGAVLAAIIIGAVIYYGSSKPPSENGENEQAKLEKKALDILGAAQKFEKDHPPNTPEAAKACIEEYRKLTRIKSLDTTTAWKNADKRIGYLNKKIEEFNALANEKAKDEFERLESTLQSLRDERRFGEVIAKFNAFAKENEDNVAGSIAKEKAEDVAQEAEHALATVIREADEHKKQKEFDKAVALLRNVVENFGIEKHVTKARERIGYVETARKQHKEELERIEKARAEKLARLIENVDKSMAEFKFDFNAVSAPMAELKKFVTKSPEEEEAVAQRRDDLDRLKKLHETLADALPMSENTFSISRTDTRGFVGKITSATTEAVTIKPANGPPVAIKWSELQAGSMFSLLKTVLPRDDRTSRIALALLYLLHNNLDKAQAEVEDAKTRDGVMPPGAKAMKERVKQVIEAAVAQLHAEAKDKKTNDTDALELYRKLRKDYIKTEYVGEHLAEIDDEIAKRATAVFDSEMEKAWREFKNGRKTKGEKVIKDLRVTLGESLTDEMKDVIAEMRGGAGQEPSWDDRPFHRMKPMEQAIYLMFAGNDPLAVKRLQRIRRAGGDDAQHAADFLKGMQKQKQFVGGSAYQQWLDMCEEGLGFHERVAGLRLVGRNTPSDVKNLRRMVTSASYILRWRLRKRGWGDAALLGGIAVVKDKPTAANLWLKRAEINFDEFDEYAKAAKKFQKVIKDYDKTCQAGGMARVGRARCRIRNKDKASLISGLAELQRTLKQFADDSDVTAMAHLGLGEACEFSGQYGKAVNHYESSYTTKRDPYRHDRIPEAMHGAARALRAGGKLNEARRLVERLNALHASYYRRHKNELEAIRK